MKEKMKIATKRFLFTLSEQTRSVGISTAVRTSSKNVSGVSCRSLRISVALSQLGVLQRSRVLDYEHEATNQHLGVDSFRLHLESVDQQVDNPGPQVVEVCQGNIPVCTGDQLLDWHVGKVEREREQRLQQVDCTPPKISAIY